MEININLANQPFIDLRPILKAIRRTMIGLLAVILVLGVGAYFVHRWAVQSRQHLNSLKAQIERVSQEQQSYQAMMQQPQNLKLLRETDELNLLFDAKAFSWTLVMRDLETALPMGVQVTGIDPTRAKDGTVTLHVRVHGPRDKGVELVRNLEHSRYFRAPRIVGESADNSLVAGQKLEPVSISSSTELDLLAEYNASSFDDSALPAIGAESSPKAAPQPNSASSADANSHLRKTTSKPHAAIRKGGPK